MEVGILVLAGRDCREGVGEGVGVGVGGGVDVWLGLGIS